jgi:hypothetical protein
MRRNRHGLFTAAFLATVVLSASAARADRIAVRVRWHASDTGAVAGYRVYARATGDFYGEAHDVGLPRAAADGTISAVVSGLDSASDYAVAVTAYAEDGRESALSNEGRLYAAGQVRPTCSELRCDSVQDCVPADSPAGLGCYDGDPCSVGSCAAGTCVLTADAPAPLALGVDRFKVAPAGRKRKRLAARATLPLELAAAAPFESARIELRDATDRLLYFATVSGDAFGPKRRGSAVAYPKRRRSRAPAGANGLRQVVLGPGREGSEILVRAASPDLARLTGKDRLMWVVRLGARCAQALDLGCGPMRRGRMRCG